MTLKFIHARDEIVPSQGDLHELVSTGVTMQDSGSLRVWWQNCLHIPWLSINSYQATTTNKLRSPWMIHEKGKISLLAAFSSSCGFCWYFPPSLLHEIACYTNRAKPSRLCFTEEKQHLEWLFNSSERMEWNESSSDPCASEHLLSSIQWRRVRILQALFFICDDNNLSNGFAIHYLSRFLLLISPSLNKS